MRTSITRTTLRQISRRTAYRTLNNAKTARRVQRLEWRRTVFTELARPLDIMIAGQVGPEASLPVMEFDYGEDDDGT
jgi:hypothetical protein